MQEKNLMKICFFIKALSDASGGAERVLSTVASMLAEKGHQVTIVTSDQTAATPFYPISPQVKIICLQIGDTRHHLNLCTLLVTAYRYYQVLRKGGFDIAVGFMHSAFIPLTIPAYCLNIPVLGSEHISFDHYETRRTQLFLYKMMVPFMAAVTVLSDAVKSNFPAIISQRMRVIPNPVSQKIMAGEKPQTEKDRNIILAVGRLTPQKDHAVLISAFAQCADQFPGWDLHIYGRGELHTQLQNQIISHSLQGRAFIHPPTKDIAPVYLSADIVAVPSRYESFGLVTIEAMSCQLPVIGFADCPGTNELIKNDVNGLLVSGTDRTMSLAKGLAELMANPEIQRRYGQQGAEMARKFQPGSIVDLWEKLLEETACGPTPPPRA
jgi:glycosyltransferase involved in cell wall biosynthesis